MNRKNKYYKRRLLLTKMAENMGKTNDGNEKLAFLACFSCKCDQDKPKVTLNVVSI